MVPRSQPERTSGPKKGDRMDIELKVQVADPVHQQIRRQLEQVIRSGQLAQGQRLPPTSELAKQWGVNYSSVQRAMDYLSAAGLVERKPRRGTFVREVTDRAVIGLLVGPHLLEETAYFFRALARAITQEIGGKEWRCLTYDQITFANEESMAESKKRLLHDIQHHKFKGLIYIGCSPSAREEFTDHDLPSVIYGLPPGELVVCSDFYDFGFAATRYLVKRGRKRIAYLRTLSTETAPMGGDRQGFADALKQHGVELNRHSILQVEQVSDLRSYSPERFGYEQMRKLLAEWDSDGGPPDGLIVSDDVMMRGAAHALTEHGIRFPDQMEIVTQANEGIDHFYTIPVARYVHPISKSAQLLVDLLWKRIVGEPLPESTELVKGELIPA